MVKSGLEKIFLKFLHGKPISSNSFYLLVLRKITNSETKITIFPHGGKSEIFFTICAWPNWHVGAKILPRFQFEGKTEVWISEVRSVKIYPYLWVGKKLTAPTAWTQWSECPGYRSSLPRWSASWRGRGPRGIPPSFGPIWSADPCYPGRPGSKVDTLNSINCPQEVHPWSEIAKGLPHQVIWAKELHWTNWSFEFPEQLWEATLLCIHGPCRDGNRYLAPFGPPDLTC